MDEAAAVTAQEEYDTQFFGFSPVAFVDGVFNAFFDYTMDVKNILPQYISLEYGETMMTKEQIEEATDNIFSSLDDVIPKAFDKLEVYILKNCMHVPRHVLLPEDAVHGNPQLKSIDLDDEAEDLYNKIIWEKQRQAILKSEIEFQKNLCEHLTSLKEMYSSLGEIEKSPEIKDLAAKLSLQKGDEMKKAISEAHRLLNSEIIN